ncbi:MAG: Gfo/Idh/MocA family oxidoreductase [Myxococcales bacterium]
MSKTAKATEVRVGQIGFGYWGPNVLRNLVALPDVRVTWVAETDPKRAAEAGRVAAGSRSASDYHQLLTADDVDAVVVTAPAAAHFAMARDALQAGKHVLVEKPLASTGAECRELISLAEKAGKVLMVGHTFLYSPPVRQLKGYVDQGTLGKVLYLYAQRVNLGRVRKDVNALWNFAPHDVSIISYLLGKEPVSVSARGFDYVQPGIADVVFMTLVYPENVAAHVHISWLDPLKVRRMTVVGDKQMAVYDDTSSDAKLAIYDRGVDKLPTPDSPRDFSDFAEFQLKVRSGDVVIPAVDFKEPLRAECAHFVECVRTGARPFTDGVHGLGVVAALEAAERSMKNGGAIEAVKVQ